MATRLAPLVALTLTLLWGQVNQVRAQLSSDELKIYTQLLAEPDTKEAIAKRLKLFEVAIERQGDPKRWLSTSYVIDLRRARIPAAEGVPFLLKFVDHPKEAVKRSAIR